MLYALLVRRTDSRQHLVEATKKSDATAADDGSELLWSRRQQEKALINGLFVIVNTVVVLGVNIAYIYGDP